MVKVLSLWPDFSDSTIYNTWHYLEKALKTQVELKIGRDQEKSCINIRRGRTLNSVVEELMPDADWVLLPEYIPKPPKKRSYKVANLTADIHGIWNTNPKEIYPPQRIVKMINKSGVDACLMAYIKLAYQNYPLKPINPDYYQKNLKPLIFHMAPCIDPKMHTFNRTTKKHDVVFLAASPRGPRASRLQDDPTFIKNIIHPFRYKIKTELPKLAKDNGWRTLIGHYLPEGTPKHITGMKEQSLRELHKRGWIIGSRYYNTLAASKAFIFGLGRFKYPCLKFVEGMYCKTCVLSDPPLTAKELHYVPNWNYVEINRENWKRKLKYYIKHDEEREEIIANGHATMMKHHTATVRAKQLAKFLEENR